MNVSRSSSPLLLGALILGAAFITPSPAASQDTDLTSSAINGIGFRDIGPAVMGGRVADLDVREDNPAHWIVGFATGGVWETKNHGTSWEPLFDDEAVSSIGDVTLAPSNPNVIWVGTGEPQNRNSSPYGGGVYRSVDGGRTWTHLGLSETRHIAKIAVHPRNPDVAYVAAVGHLWGANPERGVYRTTDGGETWENVLFIDDDTGAIDLVIDPNDPNALFAAMYQRRRTVFGFSAWGEGSGLYRTLDGGDSWTELTEGLPEGHKGRIGIDVFRRDGNLVYATVEGDGRNARGLYRSDDRGETWERVSDRNPRPMYFSMVRIDPNNPDRIYIGGVFLEVSDDGGKTWWENDGYWSIHVDNHALWVDPANSDHVILGQDGGVASTWDGARNWTHHNNIAIGQFYEIGVDNRDPYYVCGGLQDNSSWCGPSNSSDRYGIDNGDWYDVSGGDGFYNQVDPNDWRIVYTESQGGNISRRNVETGETVNIRPMWRGDEESGDGMAAAEGSEGEDESDEDERTSYDFNWNSPIVVSNHTPNTVYIGADYLMRSNDQGQSWHRASPDLTRQIDRDTLAIFNRALSEPHLSRNDGISRYGTITTVDESPLSGDILWVGTDDGNVQVTQDGGTTWTNVVDDVPHLPGPRYVSRIEASAHAEGRAYVTFDGHYDDDYAPYVYRTDNFGQDWERITNGLPDHSVNVVREHHRAENLLFVGNEVGVYATVDGGQSWHAMRGSDADNGAFPTVPVDDLVIQARENDLVVGTHGRSIWIADDLAPLEALAETGGVVAQVATLMPVRRATQWTRPGGWPFWGDIYFGRNPSDGASLRVLLSEDVDSIQLVVTGADGDTIRTLDGPTEAGLHTVLWDLRYQLPYDAPSGGGGFFGGPGAPWVQPGSYTVTLHHGDEQTSQVVEVRADPRTSPTRMAMDRRQAAMMDAFDLMAPAREAGQAIRRLDEQLDEAKELLEGLDEEPEDLIARVDSLSEKVDEIRDDMAPLNRASRAVRGMERSFAEPTADQLWSIDQGWDALPDLTARINELIETDLPALYDELNERGIRPEPGDPLEVPSRRIG